MEMRGLGTLRLQVGFGDLEIRAHTPGHPVMRVTVVWTFSSCAQITHSLNKDGTLSR